MLFCHIGHDNALSEHFCHLEDAFVISTDEFAILDDTFVISNEVRGLFVRERDILNPQSFESDGG